MQSWRGRRESAELRTTLDVLLGHLLTDLCQNRPDLAQLGRIGKLLGRCCPKSDPNLAKSGPSWPRFGEIWDNIDQPMAKISQLAQTRSKLGRGRPKCGPKRPMRVEIWPTLGFRKSCSTTWGHLFGNFWNTVATDAKIVPGPGRRISSYPKTGEKRARHVSRKVTPSDPGELPTSSPKSPDSG